MNEHSQPKKIWLLGAPALVAVILVCIYAARGIWPFGGLTVAQGDLEQQYCAMYTQLYDVLRGEASPFFSWLTALSRNQSMDMMIFGCFSPLNLLLLLFPRDGLLAGMSFFVLVKLALAAFTASWYVRRRFPALKPVWIVFFGVAYGLSGHMLIHYHNTLWLEAVILLPVYLYYAERMLTNGKVFPYALTLACLLILNFYPAAMICLFTFFAGGAYVVFLLPREQRGKAVLRIVLGTLVALLASAAVTLPAGLQMAHAARLGYSGSGGVFSPVVEYSVLRGFALCTSAFALVLLPVRAKRLFCAGEGKRAWFMLTVLAFLLIPLVFEGVDTLWHFGGNIGFSYRYGFLTVFAVLAFSAQALSERAETPVRTRSKWTNAALYALSLAALIVFCYVMLRDGRKVTAFIDWNQALFTVLSVVSAAVYTLLLLLPNRRLAAWVMLAALLVNVGCYGYSAFCADDSVVLAEASSAEALALREVVPDEGAFSRVKNEDASLTLNYPKYMGRPALSSFSSSTEPETLTMVKALGYGVSAYAIQDCGGTLFSDALLSMHTTVSLSDRFAADAAYTWLGTAGRYRVYQNAYTLPTGLVGDSTLASLDPTAYGDPFALQNALYAALSGETKPLLSTVDAAIADVTDAERETLSVLLPQDAYGEAAADWCKLTFPVRTNERVYLYDRGADGLSGCKLAAAATVAGGVQWVADTHPRTYLDGIYDVGAAGGGDMTVYLAGSAETYVDRLAVALLDTDALSAFCAAKNSAPDTENVSVGKRSLSMSVTAERDGDALLLPVRYDAGWRCQLDGKTVRPQRTVGNLTAVTLSAGTHTLSMKFTQKGLFAGVMLTVCGVIALFALALTEKKRGVLLKAVPERINSAFAAVLYAAWGAAILCCYALPMLYALAMWYKNLH